MKSNGAPTPPPSTPPYQVLTTRATSDRCRADYQSPDAARLRATKEA